MTTQDESKPKTPAAEGAPNPASPPPNPSKSEVGGRTSVPQDKDAPNTSVPQDEPNTSVPQDET